MRERSVADHEKTRSHPRKIPDQRSHRERPHDKLKLLWPRKSASRTAFDWSRRVGTHHGPQSTHPVLRSREHLRVCPLDVQRLWTVLSRIDILRAAIPGQSYSTVPWIRPGGESLLRLSGWLKVERVLRLIDVVEALDIDLPTQHPTTGTTFITVCRSTKHLDHIPGPVTKPGSIGGGLVMSARCATIFTTFATAVLLLSTVGGATPHYIWNASN